MYNMNSYDDKGFRATAVECIKVVMTVPTPVVKCGCQIYRFNSTIAEVPQEAKCLHSRFFFEVLNGGEPLLAHSNANQRLKTRHAPCVMLREERDVVKFSVKVHIEESVNVGIVHVVYGTLQCQGTIHKLRDT